MSRSWRYYCIVPSRSLESSHGPSAAGRGRNGALKVAQGTVRGVDRDGHGEVEDRGGGGASVKHGHGWAPSLG